MHDPSDRLYEAPPTPPGAVRLFFRMGGWGVVALGSVVVGLSLWADGQQRLQRAFAEDGNTVEARVLERIARSHLNVDGSVSYRYFLDLGFVTDLGERFRIRQSVNADRFEEVAEGDPVRVRYLEGDPVRVLLPEQSTPNAGQGATRTALVLGLVALGLLWRIGGWAVSGVKARRQGPPETAHVVGMERSVIRAVDGERYRLIWRNAEGRDGRSLLHKKRDLAEIAPGTPITLYRDGPHLWWAGDVGTRGT